MNEQVKLTKDQWLAAMSSGIGNKNHPVNDNNPDIGKLKAENAEMAQSDITKIIDYSEKLQSMFSVSDNLEDWVKAKLNHACDYVATVRDYLKFYSEEKDKTNIQEKWSKKYKRSINCSNPKGFSQKAHCRARKLRQAHKKTKSKSIRECYKEAILEIVREQNSSMAMGALKQLNSDAKELETMLKPTTKLEDWVKAKLNLAGEYLDDVYHHLDHFGAQGRKLDNIKEALTDPRFLSMKNLSSDELEAIILARQAKKGQAKFTDRPSISHIAYWLSPEGDVIKVNVDHEQWVRDNKKMLKGYRADQPYTSAFINGYTRISYSPDTSTLHLHNSGETAYRFLIKGDPETGTPPMTRAAKDALLKFIKDKKLNSSDVLDRGQLGLSDEPLNEHNYETGILFHEFINFYENANDDQIKEMQSYLDKGEQMTKYDLLRIKELLSHVTKMPLDKIAGLKGLESSTKESTSDVIDDNIGKTMNVQESINWKNLATIAALAASHVFGTSDLQAAAPKRPGTKQTQSVSKKVNVSKKTKSKKPEVPKFDPMIVFNQYKSVNNDFPAFLNAMHQVESNGRYGPILGDNGRALGPLQIHKPYYNDVKDKVGGKYEDVAKLSFAVKVVKAYMEKYAKEDVIDGNWEKVARIHNGGPEGHLKSATVGYAEKILNKMPTKDIAISKENKNEGLSNI